MYKTLAALWSGLKITWQFFLRSLRAVKPPQCITADDYFASVPSTLDPDQKAFVPERGRYRLDNRMEDCIMCDRCVRVCPVDCIITEGVLSKESLGTTSNGMVKRIRPLRFDINLSQCCFCGLCADACPTRCLTTTSAYDYSTSNLSDHLISFVKPCSREEENLPKGAV